MSELEKRSVCEQQVACSKDEEIRSLKFQIGGYKTQYAALKKKKDELSEELLNTKVEFKKIFQERCEAQSERDDLKGLVEILQDKSRKYDKEIEELQAEVDEISADLKFYKAKYENFKSLSWWKRLFVKP